VTSTAPDTGLAALIETRTGPIQKAARTERGYTSDYTGIIHAAAGPLFVKAVRDPGPGTASLEREAAINPAVQHISPALHWQARGHGWHALAFEYVPADHHASFKPESPDLHAVAGILNSLAGLTLPDTAKQWPETRYDRYAADGTARLLAGNALLHGDINPDNILIRPHGDATLVDWAWPAHGAAFIDPACLAVQLIAAGHTPAQAETWASRCTAWRTADPAALDAFAAAVVRMYRRFEERDPQPWRKAMTAAAAGWAAHRGVVPPG
jgi:hypothetical protein